jgi:hypothetical protein
MRKGSLLVALALLLWGLAGCGGGQVIVVTATPTPGYITVVVTPGPPSGVATVVVTPEPPSGQVPVVATEPPPPPEAGIEVLEATFAHGLSEAMEPVNPGTGFAPDETVYLSVEIKGRPKAGVVTSRFYLGDTLIVEGSVDLADVNSGLIFSVGENTYAGYSFTHTESLPLSDNYRADLFYDGAPLGSAAFQVVPPAGAIPSQITQVVLAKGTDADYNPVEPSTVFSSDQEVSLVGRGDLGVATWLEAEWYVGGELDDAGTRSLTLEENAQDVPFAFSFLPEGGWPVGEHWAVLIMNDEEVGRYAFTVASGP